MPRTIRQHKANRSKKKQQSDFIKWFCDYASVSRACRKAKVPRSTVYDWLKKDEDFKARYNESIEIAVAALEDEAIRRAHEGTLKPVYQGGKKVGSVRDYSDTLMIFLLKGLAPDKYKDRQQVDSTNKNINFNTDVSKLSDDELDKELKKYGGS